MPPPARDEVVGGEAPRGYLFDAAPETFFHDLTALAASVCLAPIALLSLVDSDRLSFESCVGLDVAEISQARSFLEAAVEEKKVLVVLDTLADERFATNSLVTGAHGIRFFAGTPLLSSEGDTLGCVCVLDRTPRAPSKEIEEALCVLARQAVALLDFHRCNTSLAQSELRFQSIIEEANEAYISFQTDGVIREWNREAERLLGWTQKEIVGSSARDTVVPADLWERVVSALSDRLVSDDVPLVATRVDGTAMTKRGLELPVEFTFLPLKIGGEARINVLLHDISARRRFAIKTEDLLKTEQEAGVELTSQNEELRELDAVKNQFVSVVSHELRSPLTAIRGYLEIVLGEEPGPLNEEQKRFLQIVDFSSEQLLRVVGDLLLIGKAEAGLALGTDEIDLGAMIDECIVAAKPTADAKQIGLWFTRSKAPSIVGDRGRISQAVANIVANAIKFTEDGHVEVRLRSKSDGVIIEVVDTGTGVPPEEVDHLFVPFFRASTATQQAIPGTGLGLSIAKEIIEAHGGSISVESQEGTGTEFRVELPTSKAPDEHPTTAQASVG